MKTFEKWPESVVTTSLQKEMTHSHFNESATEAGSLHNFSKYRGSLSLAMGITFVLSKLWRQSPESLGLLLQVEFTQ